MKTPNYYNFLPNTKLSNYLLAAGLALCLICLTGIIACNTDANAETSAAVQNSEMTQEANPKALFANLKVNPPASTIDQSGQTLTINNASEAKTFQLNSGTTINVPTNAFVDKAGKPITGTVDIEYREIRTPAEIIASGIPMRVVDEKGHDEWMQTAGMFEIRASHKGEDVFIADHKKVDVAFASEVEGDYFSWFFDEKTGVWDKIGSTDSSIPVDVPTTKADQTQIQALTKKTARKPVKPAVDDTKNRLEFTDLDVSDIPELKNSKSVILIYDGNNEAEAPDNNPWISDPGRWLKKELKPLDAARSYQLTLYGDKKYSIPVRLPLQEAELQKAMANYEKELKEYKKNVAILNAKKNQKQQQQKFARTISVSSFGFHNHDIFYGKPDIIGLAADFKFEEAYDEMMDETTVFLVTGDNKVVVSFTKDQWKRFRFSESDDNTIIAILPDNTAAYYPSSKFKQQKETIRASEGQFVFDMESTGQTIDSAEDITALLEEAVEERAVVRQNYPNPASGMTTIEYYLPKPVKQVELMLTSVNGKTIFSKKLGTKSAGEYQEQVDTAPLQTGTYVYTFVMDKEVISKKMTVL